MALKFYTSVTKGLKFKLKVLIPIFVEVIGENLVGGLFTPTPPTHPTLILNKVNIPSELCAS